MLVNMAKLFQGAVLDFHHWWNDSMHDGMHQCINDASMLDKHHPAIQLSLLTHKADTAFNSISRVYGLADQNPYEKRVTCCVSKLSNVTHSTPSRRTGVMHFTVVGKQISPPNSSAASTCPRHCFSLSACCVPLCFSPTSFSCYDCHVLEGEVRCDLMSPGKQTNRLTHR